MKRIKLCKEDGCRQPVRAKGLCIAHYSALRYLHLRMKGQGRQRPLKRPRKAKHKTLCIQPHCEANAVAKKLCPKHYRISRKPKSQPTEQKKRKRINPVSSKRRAWNDKYYAQVEKDAPYQSPVDQPDELYGKDNHYKIQRHHPFRRLGEAILCYVYITSEKHHDIEHNAKQSRANGWIWEGDPEDHVNRPWPESVEILHNWPERYRRKENMKTENTENKEAMTHVEGGGL